MNNFVQLYANWKNYRSTVNQLSRLSTRELDDLGLSIGDIPTVARKSVR